MLYDRMEPILNNNSIYPTLFDGLITESEMLESETA